MNFLPFLVTCSGELGNCCSDPGLVMVMETSRRIVGLIQIIAPILLLIMATIEFTKLMTNPERKGGLKRIHNLFVSAMLVFFVPVIASAFFGMLPQSMNISACWQQAKVSAESRRSLSFEYVSPYEKDTRSTIFVNPGDYEKGTPKPTPSSTTGGSSGVIYDVIAPGSAQGILEGAEKVHTMYEQNKWAYYSNLNQLRWGDIRYSTNNPSHMTCCATFVGSALYIGGIFSESELNKYNYNSQYGISKLCQEHGWTKITNYSQLAPGDIVIMTSPSSGGAPGHVQIYAGNGTWYNAGSTNAIQRANPYSGDASSRFLWAWRMPA